MKRSIILAAATVIIAASAVAGPWLIPGGAKGKGESAASASAAAAGTAVEVKTKGTPFRPLTAGSANRVEGMELAAQNETLALYINPETTEVAIRDKRSGKLWSTNPGERDADRLASPYEKGALSSQFALTYLDTKKIEGTMLNFNDSIEKKQFQILSIDRGLRVEYTLGDMSKGIEALPKRISKERMESAVLSKLEESEQRYITRRYELLKEEAVYERMDKALSSVLVLNKVLAAFQKAGYTEEDLQRDNAENGASGEAASAKPRFFVPIEYILDGGELLATIPADEIAESEKVQLLSLDMLMYFGAAGESDEGYLFVPDGSGSLIRLNNGKIKEDPYFQPLYGFDQTNSARRQPPIIQTARLPVFGIKSGDQALIGMIEQGDALASIRADVSGKKNSYNYVYSSFKLRTVDSVLMPSGRNMSSMPIVSPDRYQGDITVRYGFMAGGEADLSGMADQYRQVLIDRYGLQKRSLDGAMPLYIDLIGSIPKKKSFLGVPYEDLEAMTTFAEAERIVDKLHERNAAPIQMRYLGWFNGGVNHSIPVKVALDRKLGGKSGMQNLDLRMKKQGGGLYPDVAFQHVFHNSGGFQPSKDAARLVTREVAERNPYDLARMRQDAAKSSYYLLSPAKLPEYVKQFLDSYEPLGMAGLSLRDLGDALNSDFWVKNVLDRQAAKQTVVEELTKLAGTIPDLLVAGGNGYSLPYARHVVDVPMEDSGFNLTDESVPFYQMVLHGFVDYAGSPVNLADDSNPRRQLLKHLEYGASLHFLFSYQSSSKLKFTEFDRWFSVQYADWLEIAADMYEQLDGALSQVRSARITGHEQLRDDVYRTVYDNGKSIIVNYGKQAVTLDGISVGAENFAVGGGKQ
ncbi:DUF5696 domain-containing protein [Paenibacillus sp. GCM10027626]|uniref:DUF5696 domain-containing protein n=1 Tax=Paenibacillus sp. GCM10027626 TaxID=3273411 RepID=UPI003637D00F